MICTDRRLRLCRVLLAAALIFIWGNSALPAEISQAFSDWVKSLLSFGSSGEGQGSGLLRKIAHFTEFTVLGALLCWHFGMLRKQKHMPFLWGVAAACIDETIQMFVPGRAPRVTDVLIDSFGVLTGLLLLQIGHYFIRNHSNKNGGKYMKKFMSMILALAMVLSLAACGGNAAPETTEPSTEAAVSVEATCEELLNQIVEKQPVEFMGGIIPVDLTDTSEDGAWNIEYFTGLKDASQITEASVFEPMMGSIAFSMVMVRVADDAGSKTVAEAMKNGIDTRKWVCVGADDVLVAGYADMVMFIMLDTGLGLTAQSFVDVFAEVVGAEPEFVI